MQLLLLSELTILREFPPMSGYIKGCRMPAHHHRSQDLGLTVNGQAPREEAAGIVVWCSVHCNAMGVRSGSDGPADDSTVIDGVRPFPCIDVKPFRQWYCRVLRFSNSTNR